MSELLKEIKSMNDFNKNLKKWLISTTQAWKLIWVTPHTIRKHINNEKLKAIKVGPRNLFIEKEEFKRFIIDNNYNKDVIDLIDWKNEE